MQRAIPALSLLRYPLSAFSKTGASRAGSISMDNDPRRLSVNSAAARRRSSLFVPSLPSKRGLARKARTSPLRAAILVSSLIAVYVLFFRSKSPSLNSKEAQAAAALKAAPPSRWTIRGGVGAAEVHGDARDLGFKKVDDSLEQKKGGNARADAAPPVAGARKAIPPAPAQGGERRPGVGLAGEDKPIMRKMRLDDEGREAGADRKEIDRKAKADDLDDGPVFRTDDDDLDGAQNDKKDAVRGAKGKKKLPLAGGRKPIEVPPPPPPAALPNFKAEDKWGNAGWQARFKQKLPGAGGAAAHDDESSSLPPAPELEHPLVARYANFDLSRPTPTTTTRDDDDDFDDFQANPPARKNTEEDTPTSYNLTICALIPGESRFLSEWLLYHRLLGVDHFVLYDTSAGAAVGAAEVDGLADRMEAEGKGALGPTADEIKAGVARAGGASAIDDDGLIYADRIAGLEHFIDSGHVTINYMKHSAKSAASSFHQQFIDHCSATYSKTTNWLAHLDIDEFLSMAEPLYGPSSPYQDTANIPPGSGKLARSAPWQYPLHDLLSRPSTDDAACIPIPQLKYRNLGVRQLSPAQTVLDTQTRRNAIRHGNSPEKVLLHTAYTPGFVQFDGPHSCRVSSSTRRPPSGVKEEIKNSQGLVIQDGGVYTSTRLPTEPLAIAHYVQRDLNDCRAKLGAVDDPNGVHAKGRGVVICEEAYMPSQEELSSRTFTDDPQNRFLLRLPPDGTVVEDLRMKNSFASRATKAILQRWQKSGKTWSEQQIKQMRQRVKILTFD